MTTTRIADFAAGRPVEGIFSVSRKARRLSRTGDAYLALELTDATGAVSARAWENAEFFDRTVKIGDVVRASGRAVQFRDALQLEIRRMQPVGSEGEGVPLIPSSRRDPAELAGQVEFLIGEVPDEQLARVAHELWTGEHADALRRSPATASGHHAWLGGLMEHTVSVAAMCQVACEQHPHLDASVLLTAALVHDVGRARELEYAEQITTSEQGELFGHLLLGHEMLTAAGAATGADTHPRWARLVHAVSCHHGPADRCRTGEAHALLQLNMLDARLTPRGPAA